MMRAGRLRHRVDLQSFTESQSASGEPVKTWVTDAVLWAGVSPLQGNESIKAQQVRPNVTHEVRMRWRRGVTSANRILAPHEATTLAAGTTTTTGTSIVVSLAIGREAGNFPIRIDSEDMLVTAGHGTTGLTVTRGAYSTTAATHTSGAAVEYLIPLNIEAALDPQERNTELQLLCKESE